MEELANDNSETGLDGQPGPFKQVRSTRSAQPGRVYKSEPEGGVGDSRIYLAVLGSELYVILFEKNNRQYFDKIISLRLLFYTTKKRIEN